MDAVYLNNFWKVKEHIYFMDGTHCILLEYQMMLDLGFFYSIQYDNIYSNMSILGWNRHDIEYLKNQDTRKDFHTCKRTY